MRALGLFLVWLPFILTVTHGFHVGGIAALASVYGTIAAFMGCILLGLYLLHRYDPE